MKPPRIVELVGVAGAGKTTLAQALSKRSERIVLSDHPYFRKAEDIPFFIWNTLLMAPTFIKEFATNGIKSLTPQEMAWMVILNGWHHVLRRQVSKHDAIIILDQGPVSILAELYVLHSMSFQSQASKKWWECTLKAWSDTLDLFIWLDTSDPTLIERVRTRHKWHLIKDQSDLEALDLNTSFRSINNKLISILTTDASGPKLIDFDTGQESLDTITGKTLVALEVENHKAFVSR